MTAVSPSGVVERIERELREIWVSGASPGDVPKTRACTMNIVVVAADGAEAAKALPIVDEVTRTVPARAIVVELDPAGKDGLEGEATAVCDVGERGAVCSERLRLVARGAVAGRLASIIQALSVSEMPVTVVWLGPARPEDPVFAGVAATAERIILDSDQSGLASLVGVARWARADETRPAVADLAWTRLSLWQELCARFFDDPRAREASLGVTHLALAQACEAGALLGPSAALLFGWLGTRLGWTAGARPGGGLRVARPDGGDVTVRLGSLRRPEGVRVAALAGVSFEAVHGDVELRGAIDRELASGLSEEEPDKDVLAWRVEVKVGGDGRSVEQRVRLRGNGGARLLERTLLRPAKDPSLLEAVAFLEPLLGKGLVCA